MGGQVLGDAVRIKQVITNLVRRNRSACRQVMGEKDKLLMIMRLGLVLWSGVQCGEVHKEGPYSGEAAGSWSRGQRFLT